MKKSCKRGQAATEFLTTYGWAIVIIALVLAALVWLGVFNTSQAIPDRCAFEPGMQCDSIKLIAAEGGSGWTLVVQELRITNRLPERIAYCNVECRSGDEPQHMPTAAYCASFATYLASGDSHIINIQSGPLGLPLPIICKDGSGEEFLRVSGPGQIVTPNIFIYYVKEGDSGTGNARVARGTIAARAEFGEI
ncbi:MAG: hypothetical protein Q7T16_03330 [Candidatus Burarchaeum sp.]|nr:hypothetical protein [Candidatus Burarchaeum sp.]MDO8339664.1 hypothetical protein [Candidatus Burarchaeum sp.]